MLVAREPSNCLADVGPEAEEPLGPIAAKVHEVPADALQRLDDRYVAGESLEEGH